MNLRGIWEETTISPVPTLTHKHVGAQLFIDTQKNAQISIKMECGLTTKEELGFHRPTTDKVLALFLNFVLTRPSFSTLFEQRYNTMRFNVTKNLIQPDKVLSYPPDYVRGTNCSVV